MVWSETELLEKLQSVVVPNIAMSMTEERPPASEDFTPHMTHSLTLLQTLVTDLPSSPLSLETLPLALVLVSEHSQTTGQASLPPWTSTDHQDLASLLLRQLTASQSLQDLLQLQEGKIVHTILTWLQPRLAKFTLHPSAAHCLVWLVFHLENPILGDITASLLPPALNLVDCWLPVYKVPGCLILHHLSTTLPPTQLTWYGRTRLLSDALLPLLHSQDTTVLSAAGPPLLQVTRLLQLSHSPGPAVPGPADMLVKQLLSCLELESANTDRSSQLASLLLLTVDLLGRGVARWVTKISSLLCSHLNSGLYTTGLLALLPNLAKQVPKCLAREVDNLVPALVKCAYHKSWDSRETDLTTLSDCLATIFACDLPRAKVLCQGLDKVKVNLRFDTVVKSSGLCS